MYLQGSYRNSTNIRAESDVDIIVELTSAFQRDLSHIPETSQKQFLSDFSDANYGLTQFKTDVVTALENYYNKRNVIIGNKSIKVSGGNNYLPADVIVCIQYRNYRRYNGISDQDYVPGIVFYSSVDRHQIINYPKQHFDNGVSKNSPNSTNGMFKPMVRIFKNARTRLIENGIISPEIASSYFIECLLYNVPDGKYQQNYSTTFFNILDFLQKANLPAFVCQNEQYNLFGNTEEQWTEKDAKSLISSYIKLWNDW